MSKKNGWRNWRFDEMATQVNDRIDDPSKANVDRYVGLEHLDSESFTIRRWGSPSDVEATKLIFKKGDLILGRRRVYQRKLAVADFDGICSAHAMVLRGKPEVALPEFLPFFMQSDLFMNRAKEISVGSLSPTINWKTLARQEFALPPLKEQRRQAQILQICRTLIESLSNTSDQCDVVMSAAIERAIKDAEAHPSTRTLAIEDLGKSGDSVLKTGPFGSKLKTKFFVESGRPIITIGSILNEGLDASQFFFLDRKRISEFNAYETAPEDIVFSRVADVGRCHLIRPEESGYIISSNLIRIRIDSAIIRPYYLWLLLRHSSSMRKQIARLTTQAAGRLLVNTKTMSRLRFAVPNEDLQKTVIKLHQELMKAGLDLRKRALHARHILHEIRETIFATRAR